MNPFGYERATDLRSTLQALSQTTVTLLAGGTELLNWMRLGIQTPERILDIARLPELHGIETVDGRLRIGALAKLNDVAQHPAVVGNFPVLSQAILKAASAQLRNLATIGGNLLQKTRCAYFRDAAPMECNKRLHGSGCAALHGFNDRHALFGWSDHCVATHPSDPAVALAALDATVVTRSTIGERRLDIADLYLLPKATPWLETVIGRDEVITAIEIDGRAPQSAYVKVRERESYEYALVSAAADLQIDGKHIRKARLALGSVALRPWRLEASEKLLAGIAVGSPGIAEAVDAGLAYARPLAHNQYKIKLARNAMLRAIEQAAQS